MDLLRIAFIFGFVIICLIVFADWLEYRDLKRRLREQHEKDLLFNLIPIEVSESTAPGEALFIAPDVFNLRGEINPNKVVYIKNLEETKA